jgi:hypothetical protein
MLLVLATLTCLFLGAAPIHGAAPKKKIPTAAPPATGPSTMPVVTGPMTSLAGEAGLPHYLVGTDRGVADGDGYHGGLHGADADLGTHDFTFDVLVKPSESEKSKSKEKEKGFTIGIGKGPDKDSDRPGHSHIAESVYLHVAGTSAESSATLTAEKTVYQLGKFPATAGPHLVHFQRTVNELIVSVTANYKAGAAPTVSGTIPDLAQTAPFLAAGNAGLFLKGDAGWSAVALTSNGKPVDPVTAPAPGVAAAPPAKEPAAGPLANLGETKQLPDAFEPRHDVEIGKEGLDLSVFRGVRTRTGDFINKDFTLDVVYSWALDSKKDKTRITVGLGDGGRVETERDPFGKGHPAAARASDAVCLQLQGGDVAIQFAGAETKHTGRPAPSGRSGSSAGEIEVARLGEADHGPHRLRISKHGDTMTVAFNADYKGQFTPQYTKTILSLKADAPFLDAQNSYVFIQGDSGTIHQLQLTVEGETLLVAEGGLNLPRFAVESVPLHQSLLRDPKAAAGRQFAIDSIFSSPKGLTLSPAGDLAWTPTHDQIGSQSFKIDVTESGHTTTEAVAIEVVSADDAKAAGGDPYKIAGLYMLKIESEEHEVAPGLGGTSLLLEGSQVRRLGPDGLAVVATITLPRVYSKIAERDDCFIAVSSKDKLIDILDKKTLKVRHSGSLAYHSINSLCLNPLHPVDYLAVEKGLNGESSQIVLFDEQTGGVREPAGCQGSFACIAPDGQRLYTAYRRTFQTGTTLDPNTFEIIPTYGDESKLFVYDISAGDPRHIGTINPAGANGKGIAISPDGKRVSYLSYTGLREYIPAWDTSDMRKVPVGYAAKEHQADCEKVTFDPTLPIAAAPAKNAAGAVCFNRETGQYEADSLATASPLPANTKVSRVYFSPDGTSLLLDCDRKGDRFLKKVKLNLTDAERAAAKQATPAR